MYVYLKLPEDHVTFTLGIECTECGDAKLEHPAFQVRTELLS